MKSLYSLALEVQLCVVDPVYTSTTKIYKWSSWNEPKLSSGTRARLNFRLAVNNPLARGTTSLMSSQLDTGLRLYMQGFISIKFSLEDNFVWLMVAPSQHSKARASLRLENSWLTYVK